jgi:hypothetical protein
MDREVIIFSGIILCGLVIFLLLQKVFNIKCSKAISIYIVFILLIASFFASHNINLVENSLKEEPTKNITTTEEKPVNNENGVSENTTQNDIITVLETLAKKIVEKTPLLSTVIFIVVFLGFGCYALFCSEKLNTGTEKSKIYSALLTRLLMVSFASSTVPTGISLILCALVESIKIEQMADGLEVYFAYAGLSLIFMTVIVIFEEKQRIDDLWKPSKNNSENEKVIN